MRFSEEFHVEVTDSEDWFDPDLTIDTKLFIDPILLLEDGGHWAEAHQRLISHFAHCYSLIAKAGSPGSLQDKAANKLLSFPEPAEFGLGYSASGTSGAGSADGYARSMADGIAVAINAGMSAPKHIEEIGILHEGIGADRISDAVANVLKWDFIQYTQEIAKKHNIPVKAQKIRNAKCNLEAARWITRTIELPYNQYTQKPIILVPRRFLNDLPTLNADDWFESTVNDDVRTELNIGIGAKVPKWKIIKLALAHPQAIREWAQEQTTRKDLKGYDFSNDPKGVVQWDKYPKEWAIQQLSESEKFRIQTNDDLADLLMYILREFKEFIENQRGWELFWDNGKPKNERAIQLAFLGLARCFLKAYAIELDREVELGKGPVDFKASRGPSIKSLIEIKKDTNGKFWNGLNSQLVSYLQSDQSQYGWFVAVRFSNSKSSDKKLAGLAEQVIETNRKENTSIKFIIIDARPKESASKL